MHEGALCRRSEVFSPWYPDAVGGAQHSRPPAPATDCSGAEDVMISPCPSSSHLSVFGWRIVAFKGLRLVGSKLKHPPLFHPRLNVVCETLQCQVESKFIVAYREPDEGSRVSGDVPAPSINYTVFSLSYQIIYYTIPS